MYINNFVTHESMLVHHQAVSTTYAAWKLICCTTDEFKLIRLYKNHTEWEVPCDAGI